jgi:hypothetical protein
MRPRHVFFICYAVCWSAILSHYGHPFVGLLPWVVIALTSVRLVAVAGVVMAIGCGGAPDGRGGAEAQAIEEVDAGTGTPAWCAPLAPYQTSCKLDPSSACESHNGAKAAAAYLCGGWASPSGCVGFTPDKCAAMVFCCD